MTPPPNGGRDMLTLQCWMWISGGGYFGWMDQCYAYVGDPLMIEQLRRTEKTLCKEGLQTRVIEE